MQLAQMGIITDPEYIIQNLNMPDKEMLMRKMEEDKQKMVDAQKQAIQEEQRMPPDLSVFGSNRDEMMNNLRNNPGMLAQAKQQIEN